MRPGQTKPGRPGEAQWKPRKARTGPREAKGRPAGGHREAREAKGRPKGGQGRPREAKGEAKGGQREAKGRPRRGQGEAKGGQERPREARPGQEAKQSQNGPKTDQNDLFFETLFGTIFEEKKVRKSS